MSTISVSVAYVTATEERLVRLDVAPGTTVAAAVAAAGMADLLAAPAETTVAIFGRSASLQDPLREGDRVEILRPLRADPKDIRRARARNAGGPRS